MRTSVPADPSMSEAAVDPYADDPVFIAHDGGKLGVVATKPLAGREDLALLYTPGVAKVSAAIADDARLAERYTSKRHTVAVVTDGTAVLGLGDIGPLAALPVMEGKAVLFKEFAGVDAIPLCLETGTVDELVDAIARLAPGFGGINLEDISAPRCFDIEDKLARRLPIPVFHDDQHGTAIVVLAGLLNGCRVVGKTLPGLRVVISGAGAAGIAIANLLREMGVTDLVVCDSRGILGPDRRDITGHKAKVAGWSNPRQLTGPIGKAMIGADVLIGVSGGLIEEADVAVLAPASMIFALANPTPEVHPEIAGRYAAIVATGRSDYPNQINNVLAFPGVFRGALDAGARRITEKMKVAAAEAIFSVVGDDLAPDHIVPSPLDPRVGPAVAAAVAAAAEV